MAVDVFIVKGIRRAKFKFFAVVENGTPSGWLVNAIAWQLAGREAMEMLVVEATSVKNNRLPDRLHHAGFASFQWVLDRLPAEAGSFTATGGAKCLGQHQETEDGETDVTNHKTGDDSRSSSRSSKRFPRLSAMRFSGKTFAGKIAPRRGLYAAAYQ